MASDASSSSADGLPAPVRAFGGAAVVVVLALACASIFLSLGDAFLRSVGIERGTALYTALRSASQFVGFGVAGAGFLTATDQWELIHRRRPTRRDLGWTAAGFGVLVLFYLVISVGLTVLGVDSGQSVLEQQILDQPVLGLYYIPVTVLLVAPTEELVFRGAVQGLLRREYGVPFAVVGSSAAFASIHASSFTGEGALVSLTVVLVLGGVLGLVYERSENLLAPIVAHALYNVVQFAMTYAAAVGAL